MQHLRNRLVISFIIALIITALTYAHLSNRRNYGCLYVAQDYSTAGDICGSTTSIPCGYINGVQNVKRCLSNYYYDYRGLPLPIMKTTVSYGNQFKILTTLADVAIWFVPTFIILSIYQMLLNKIRHGTKSNHISK